jgi:hypothetical protein
MQTCFAHMRKTDTLRPWGMADVVSMGGIQSIAPSRRSVLPAPIDARRHITTSTPETSPTLRRHCLFGGTTPIPVVTANGRPQARNEEGSCGNERY